MATVLVVEDERALADLLTRVLAAEGHRVQKAIDGESALRLHATEEPDVVILDWLLPGLDGLEVLRRLRQTAPTPVLMLTARGEEIDRVQGLEVGADDYLTKPFSMRELLARVRALLRRDVLLRRTIETDRAGADSADYGPLQINPSAHEATIGDAPLALTPLEFKLLHLLVRNPGRTFGRSYLLRTLWDGDYVGGDRAVDNAVLRLRRKLGETGDAIETVWGVGYRLRRP